MSRDTRRARYAQLPNFEPRDSIMSEAQKSGALKLAILTEPDRVKEKKR